MKNGKYSKWDIMYFLCACTISIVLVTGVIIKVCYIYLPQVKEAAEKAEISKVEMAFGLYGKHLPGDKVQVFNSVVDEKFQIDYSDDVFADQVTGWIIILMPIAFVVCILCVIYKLIKKRVRILKDRFLQKKYFEKYSLKGNEIKVKSIGGSISQVNFINKLLICLYEVGGISFINNDYHNDIGVYNIQFNDIICFSRYGDFYTSMSINGGGSSYGRAALGYLIAGPMGGIVASRNQVNGQTFVHDNRETLLFVKENNEEKYIFLDPNFYDFLMHILPNKEMGIMANKEKNNIKGEGKLEKIKTLGELKANGFIDEVEFTKLKSELI